LLDSSLLVLALLGTRPREPSVAQDEQMLPTPRKSLLNSYLSAQLLLPCSSGSHRWLWLLWLWGSRSCLDQLPAWKFHRNAAGGAGCREEMEICCSVQVFAEIPWFNLVVSWDF